MPTNQIDFLKPTFERLDFVSNVVVEQYSMVITRTEDPPVRIGFVHQDPLGVDEVGQLLEAHPDVQVVVNVPKGARLLGEAIIRCHEASVAIGSVADGMRALRLSNPGEYRDRETEFALRGLRQHGAVQAIEILDDKRLLLERHQLPSLTVFIGSEYQPTAHSVRSAIQRYGTFDIYVATNPNSHPTAEAVEVGLELGCRVLRWGPLLGELNR
ncbi:hypothetical protein [Agreia sp. Leaf244]|uniref:hypothetical protein n=1 Tax=Agreia sp. Leaf244 TaxID=1736305 RepID=UPI0012FC5A79|nr:hypothetical protein [Agreia sp. Leaf244]